MPNITQNSSLPNQINQIFSGNSLASNSHPQIESKAKESFNKVYKNELANGAKKTAEANKPSPKNNTPQTKVDKTGKTQQSEKPQTLNKKMATDEEDRSAVEDMTLSGTSSLLQLVDHIAAITQQTSANSEQESSATGEKDLALTSSNQAVLSANVIPDEAQARDSFDAAKNTNSDSLNAIGKSQENKIGASTNAIGSEASSSSEASASAPPSMSPRISNATAEIAPRSSAGDKIQIQTPPSSGMATSTGLPIQDLKSAHATIEIKNSGTEEAQLASGFAMPRTLNKQDVKQENKPEITSVKVGSTSESTNLNSAPMTLQTISIAKDEFATTPLRSLQTSEKIEKTESDVTNNLTALFAADIPSIPTQTSEKSTTSKVSNSFTTESDGKKSASEAAIASLSDHLSPSQDSLSSGKSTLLTEQFNSKEAFSKELNNRLAENGSNYSDKTQVTTSTTISNTGPALPPALGIEVNTIAAAQLQDHISPRVGSKAWDSAIGQKMIWMVAGEESSVQLSLNPPDLGPLQIVLSVNDHQIDASFVSEHLDVREAIEAASPKLKEMMENAGISLSGFSVSAQAQSSGNAFTQSQQQRGTSSANQSAKSEPANSELLSGLQNRGTSGTGLVDTFV